MKETNRLLQLKWRTKLILIALLSILIIGSSIMLAINQFRSDIFQRYMVKLAKPLVSVLINQIEHNMRVHTPDHFQSFLEGFEVTQEINSINILTNSRQIYFSSDSTRIGEFVQIPDYKHDLVSTDGDIMIYALTDSIPTIKVVKDIHNFPQCSKCHNPLEKTIGYIEFHIDNSIESKFENILLAYDFISFFIFMLLFATVVVFVHNYFFQRSFNQIKEGIKSIEDGNLDVRINIHTPGELNHLADSINMMVQKLQQAREELDRLHRKQIDRAGQLASVGELAASVAHEIKNPISGIRNALEIILDKNRELQDEPIFQEMLSQINRVFKTIQDLMSYARPRKPHFISLDLCNILEQVISLYRDQIQKSNILLAEDYTQNCTEIQADGELLKQVFVNLLLNAFQATSKVEEGKIIIAIQIDKEENLVSILFKDNGKGIPEEQRELIFKPFYTTKHKGTGLGLSLSQSIVLKHRGKISVFSEIGEGTEFKVELPLNHNKY